MYRWNVDRFVDENRARILSHPSRSKCIQNRAWNRITSERVRAKIFLFFFESYFESGIEEEIFLKMIKQSFGSRKIKFYLLIEKKKNNGYFTFSKKNLKYRSKNLIIWTKNHIHKESSIVFSPLSCSPCFFNLFTFN